MNNAQRELDALLRRNPELGVVDADVRRGTPAEAAQWLAMHPAPQPMTRRIVLPLPPSANRYWRYVAGRPVVSAQARDYKAEVAVIASIAGWSPVAEDVAVVLRFYRQRKHGDLDNYVKILLDALKHIAYMDDSQVSELHMWRHDDKDYPRVEVEVRMVTA